MVNAVDSPQSQETTEPTAILKMLYVWDRFVKAGGLLFLAFLLLYEGIDIAYSHDEDYMYEPTSKLRQTAIGVFIWLLESHSVGYGEPLVQHPRVHQAGFFEQELDWLTRGSPLRTDCLLVRLLVDIFSRSTFHLFGERYFHSEE